MQTQKGSHFISGLVQLHCICKLDDAMVKTSKLLNFHFSKKPKKPASYIYILLLKYSQPNKTLNLIIKSIIDLIIHGTTKERKQTLRKLNLCISKVKLRKSVVAFKVFSPPLDIPSIGSDLRRKRADFGRFK